MRCVRRQSLHMSPKLYQLCISMSLSCSLPVICFLFLCFPGSSLVVVGDWFLHPHLAIILTVANIYFLIPVPALPMFESLRSTIFHSVKHTVSTFAFARLQLNHIGIDTRDTNGEPKIDRFSVDLCQYTIQINAPSIHGSHIRWGTYRSQVRQNSAPVQVPYCRLRQHCVNTCVHKLSHEIPKRVYLTGKSVVLTVNSWGYPG